MASPNVTEPQCPGIINPMTPFAFLPPDIAYQTTTGTHILVGALGALIWDILSNLVGDYKLLFKLRFGLPTVVYFASRIAALLYVLMSTIFETAPISHCRELQIVIGVLYPLAIPLSSLLFFFRVLGVFNRNKYIGSFFFILWLSVLGGCLTVAVGVEASNLGPTKYCIDIGLKSWVASSGITALIHDTCVFLAISWRLLLNARVDPNLENGFKIFLYGKYLPAFSRSLLQDGQMYFMITVGSNLLTVIMVYVPGVPVPYRTMFTVPNIALTNMMACHVFRNTKFGIIKQSYPSTTRSTTRLGSIPLAFRRTVGEQDTVTIDHTQCLPTDIEDNKTVERIDYCPELMESQTPKVDYSV